MVCSHSVRLVEPTPCGQHVIVVPTVKADGHIDPQMWHIMSNALVTTFKGKSSTALPRLVRVAASPPL